MNSDALRQSARGEGLSLAAELLRYLSQHPEAQDTVEGIAEWWLLERRVAQAIAEVEKALSELVAKGYIIREERSDGRTHYRLNRERERELPTYLKTLQSNS